LKLNTENLKLYQEPGPDQRAAIDRSVRHPVMFFFTSASAWLAVSLLFGLVSMFKLRMPGLADECSWLDYGRLMPAHLDTLIYGWGVQMAFGVLVWLLARLSWNECRNAGTILVAGHLWNLGVLAGLIGLLSGHSTGISWMEFPAFAWPALLTAYAAIAVWALVQLRLRPKGEPFVAYWFALAAVLWFPWLFATAHLFVFVFIGHPLATPLVGAWYKSGMLYLFFVPVAAAAAMYLASKVSGRALASRSSALLGFWALAIVAPWAGMQKLAGAPVPYFLPYIGAAATVFLAIPLLAVSGNVLVTLAGCRNLATKSPALRFVAAGMFGMVILAAANLTMFIPGATLPLSQFSISGYSYDVFALYGVFGMTAFGAVYFIVPRLVRCEWPSGGMIRSHFWFSVYGALTIALFGIFGGLAQGADQENWDAPWAFAVTALQNSASGLAFGWALLVFANFFFFLQLLAMWLRFGAKASTPTLLEVSSDKVQVSSQREATPDEALETSNLRLLTSRSFILGLVGSFGLAWLLVVVAPFLSMRSLPAARLDEAADGQAGFYHPKRAGRTLDGARVYAANGCNQCHTQLVRPTYAGTDMFRDDWGGLAADMDRGDTRRETNAYDFQGERHAMLGVARIGPDLSNLGRRLDARFGSADGPSAEQWLMRHLYAPRLDLDRSNSICPPHKFLFKSEPVRGARSSEALEGIGKPGEQVLPSAEARALVDYLRNLSKDQKTPASLTPLKETDLAGAP